MTSGSGDSSLSVKESLLFMAELLICATTYHAAVYAHDFEQPKIDSLVKVKKCSPAHAKVLDNMITGMIIHDLRPARMVKGRGF